MFKVPKDGRHSFVELHINVELENYMNIRRKYIKP